MPLAARPPFSLVCSRHWLWCQWHARAPQPLERLPGSSRRRFARSVAPRSRRPDAWGTNLRIQSPHRQPRWTRGKALKLRPSADRQWVPPGHGNVARGTKSSDLGMVITPLAKHLTQLSIHAWAEGCQPRRAIDKDSSSLPPHGWQAAPCSWLHAPRSPTGVWPPRLAHSGPGSLDGWDESSETRREPVALPAGLLKIWSTTT